MKTRGLQVILAASIFILASCETLRFTPPPVRLNDTRECAITFSVVGSVVSGKTFTSSAYFSSVSKRAAIDKIGKQIISEGQSISMIDHDDGLISVGGHVSFSGISNRAPITAIVESDGRGVKVKMRALTGAGNFSADDAVKEYFCRVFTAVN